MASSTYTCLLCGSSCLATCFATHIAGFVCHNATCLAFDIETIDLITNQNISTPPPAELLTKAIVSPATRPHDPHSSSPAVSPEERREKANEPRTTIKPRMTQEEKVMEVIAALRSASDPFSTDYLLSHPLAPSLTEIIPGLFVGNIACVDNERILKAYKIDAVISIVSRRRAPFPGSRPPARGEGPHPLEKLFSLEDRMVITAGDTTSEDLIQYFGDACRFIYQNRHPATATTVADPDNVAQDGVEDNVHSTLTTNKEAKRPKARRVLVHCTMGISRSATIVAAYLMWRRKHSAARVLALMKKRRPRVNPNVGFIDQLLVWGDVGYNIWENKLFQIAYCEYVLLQMRLKNNEGLEGLKRAARMCSRRG